MEKRNLEESCATKFCFRLKENATETYEKLQQAYGDHAVSRAQVYRRHKAFLDGRLSVEDETCSGRPCTSKTRKMWPKWGLTWGLIDVWQSEWSVVIWIWIIKPFTFWPRIGACGKFFAKLVPKNVTNEQKETRRIVCLDFLERTENDEFFFQICRNRWWIVYFRVRSRNQTTKFGVAHVQLTASEENKNEQIENHILANLFFRQSVCCS